MEPSEKPAPIEESQPERGGASLQHHVPIGREPSRAFLTILAATVSLGIAATAWGLLFLSGRLQLPPWQVAVIPAAGIGYCAAAVARRWSRLLVVILFVSATIMAGVGEWFHFAGGLRASLRASLGESQSNAIQASIRSQIASRAATSKEPSSRDEKEGGSAPTIGKSVAPGVPDIRKNAGPVGAHEKPQGKSHGNQKEPSKREPLPNPNTVDASSSHERQTVAAAEGTQHAKPQASSTNQEPASAATRSPAEASFSLWLSVKLYIDRLSIYWPGLSLSLLLSLFGAFQAARMTLQRYK